jgi:hypothetical protein
MTAAVNSIRTERIDENAASPALGGLVRRFGVLFLDAGDDEFVGLEAAFAGHGGQFVTQ